MSHESVSAADLARADQARAAIAEQADRAAQEGPRCCAHPLCVGPELVTELVEITMHSPTVTVTMLCAALRVLGETRAERQAGKAA